MKPLKIENEKQTRLPMCVFTVLIESLMPIKINFNGMKLKIKKTRNTER